MGSITEFITPGGDEMVVIPKNDYEQLAPIEDSDDREYLPQKFNQRIKAGENPVKVWRQYRRLHQAQLSKLCGATQPTISHIEKDGVKFVSMGYLLAAALRCRIDDLIRDDTVREQPAASPSPNGESALRLL